MRNVHGKEANRTTEIRKKEKKRQQQNGMKYAKSETQQRRAKLITIFTTTSEFSRSVLERHRIR